MSESFDGVPEIETHGVTKVFADGGVQALAGVDLTVAAGEFVAVTGSSGCGKSRLLGLLAALVAPTSGSVRVRSYALDELHDTDSFRIHEVGLVFQFHNLLPRLSALHNVEIAMLGSTRPHAERAGIALDLLDEVGLAHLSHRRPPQLSGGERQRVAVARALPTSRPCSSPTSRRGDSTAGRPRWSSPCPIASGPTGGSRS